MVTAYFIPIENILRLFPFIATVVLIPFCCIHYHLYGRHHPWRAILFYALLFFLMMAFYLTQLPFPKITEALCETNRARRPPQLTPFNFVGVIIQRSQVSVFGFSLPTFVYILMNNGGFLQAFFNFLLLLPLGLGLRFLFKLNFITTFLIALGVTSLFEVTQITGIYGLYPCPYRLLDIDDFILNTGGAVVGYLIVPFLTQLSVPPAPSRVNMKPVPRGRRLAAISIDMLTVSFISKIMARLLGNRSQLPPLALMLIVLTVWFILIPYYWQSQTVGKKLVGLQVTDIDGAVPSLLQFVLRYAVLLLIPTIISSLVILYVNSVPFVAISLNWLWFGYLAMEVILFVGLTIIRHDQRGFHELLSRTRNILIERH